MTNNTPHRERCAACQQVSPVSFSVPDAVWDACIHPNFHISILCLSCFISRADEKLIKWEMGIRFFPTSMVTQIEIMERARKEIAA